MRTRKNLLISALGLLLVLTGFLSCEKFEGSQTVPAYISVDTFKLANNSQLELGFISHNITDVWVYVDDEIVGAFELPAERIPLLLEGKHKLTLAPGIKYNGMSGTRGPYPFLEPDIDTGFIFYVDSIVKVSPVVRYYNTTFAAWLEDFDDAANSLQPSPDSDTTLQFLTYEPPDTVLFGNASGKGYLDQEHSVLEVASYNEEVPGIVLPTNTAPVFLEMQYNIDIPLIVGLFIIETGVQITRHPIVVLNPTYGDWKKIYVNMTPTVSDNVNADYFNVFIRAEIPAGLNSAIIKIDNLKLLTNQEP